MADGMTIRWYPERFKAKLNTQMQRNLDRASIALTNEITDSFGSSGADGERSGATKAQRAANRSQAWGPPNVDTGHLKRNIGYDKPAGRPLVRRVGTSIGSKDSVGYAMWLEFGTRGMLPRPFLRPALQRMRTRLRKMLTTPMRDSGGAPSSLAEAAAQAGSWNEFQSSTAGQFGANRQQAAAAWYSARG